MLVNYVDIDGDPVTIETRTDGIWLTIENQTYSKAKDHVPVTMDSGLARLTPDQAGYIADALVKAKTEMELIERTKDLETWNKPKMVQG